MQSSAAEKLANKRKLWRLKLSFSSTKNFFLLKTPPNPISRDTALKTVTREDSTELHPPPHESETNDIEVVECNDEDDTGINDEYVNTIKNQRSTLI